MITLKFTMVANAVSCLLFGLVFSLLPSQVALFLSTTAPAADSVFIVIGVALIINGCHLFLASRTPIPNKALVLYFSGGDFFWVVASIVLVTFNIWITSLAGIVATIAIALMVGTFGVLQVIKIK